MRAQQENRPSALLVPSPPRSAADAVLRVVPAITEIQEEISVPAKSKKLTSKAVRRKPAQRNKSTPKPKAGEKQLVRQGAARKKARRHKQPSAAQNALPQLVPVEKQSTPANHAEIAVNPVFASVLVMPEDERVEPATLAGNEIKVDLSRAEEHDASAARPAPATSEMNVASISASAMERQPQLQSFAAIQWKGLLRILTRAWTWTQRKLRSHQVRKRLRVCETVSLGEKRFVAVIQVDGEQFLVGGSSSSVSTLAHLEPRREFSDVFHSRCEQGVGQA